MFFDKGNLINDNILKFLKLYQLHPDIYLNEPSAFLLLEQANEKVKNYLKLAETITDLKEQFEKIEIESDLISSDYEIKTIQDISKSPDFLRQTKVYSYIRTIFEELNRSNFIQELLLTDYVEADSFPINDLFFKSILGEKAKSTYHHHKKKLRKSLLFDYDENNKLCQPNRGLLILKGLLDEIIKDREFLDSPEAEKRLFFQILCETFSSEIKTFILIAIWDEAIYSFTKIQDFVVSIYHLSRQNKPGLKSPSSSLIS